MIFSNKRPNAQWNLLEPSLTPLLPTPCLGSSVLSLCSRCGAMCARVKGGAADWLFSLLNIAVSERSQHQLVQTHNIIHTGEQRLDAHPTLELSKFVNGFCFTWFWSQLFYTCLTTLQSTGQQTEEGSSMRQLFMYSEMPKIGFQTKTNLMAACS